ncbi:MAG TPA: universal stress protein [Chitinophagaceae bacterium]
MIGQIKNILVPVDFSENTDVAISKALEFCQEENDSTIHLYHIQRIVLGGFSYIISSVVAGYTRQQVNSDIKKATIKLENLKKSIEKDRKNIKILCWVSFGDPVQESIIKKARELSADLIIIGKHSHHTLLPFLNTVVPSKLAAATHTPVLTAKPGSLHHEIKTVVIPVGNQFPETKLEMIRAFRSKSRPHIRFVIFPGDGTGTSDPRQLLIHTFRTFKSRFSNPVDYDILDSGNKARALLKYCNKVGADVLIVYHGSETRVGNWVNSHISDLVPAESKTQILSVTPA